LPTYLLILIIFPCLMQKFSFQSMENSRIMIAADRTAADAKDPDHWDKLPRNIRAASATVKASSSRHSTQDRSEDDSDDEILMYYDPTPLAYAFPTTPLAYAVPSSAIPDEEVVDAAPLNQGPPPAGIRIGRKRGVRPQPEPTQKRQKVGAPHPKKPRPVASG
jgi:hypothetical protein